MFFLGQYMNLILVHGRFERFAILDYINHFRYIIIVLGVVNVTVSELSSVICTINQT